MKKIILVLIILWATASFAFAAKGGKVKPSVILRELIGKSKLLFFMLLAVAPSLLVAAQHYIQSNFDDVILETGAAANFTLTEMDGITSAPIHEFYQDVYYVDSDNNFKRRRLVNGEIEDEPLIEGVDDFQLQYGIDTDADNIADTFTTTPAHTNYSGWQNVKTVTVSLLISGEAVSQPDAKTYQYADKTNETFNDKRKRRLFSFVVAVGNQ